MLIKYPKSTIISDKSYENYILTLPTSQVMHHSESNILSHEQFGVYKLFLHLVQLLTDVHSSHGHC